MTRLLQLQVYKSVLPVLKGKNFSHKIRLFAANLEQISDFIKQLYEYFFLKKNEIKKAQKNISSELLASFGRQLTETEDIQSQLNRSALD